VTRLRFSLIVLPVLALIGALLFALGPQPAEAHALLARSDPASNAQLKGPPTDVTAFFTESLDTHLSKLRVVDSNGDTVDDGNLTYGPDPAQMEIGIKGTLQPGYYTVLWETLSAVDGHLFKGFYTFTVLNPDGTQPQGQAFQGGSSGGTTAKPDTVAVRWGRLLGITAVLGSVVFFLVIVLGALSEVDEPWRARWRRAALDRVLLVAGGAVCVLAIVAAGELWVQANELGGLSYIDDVLRNDWGTRWIQRQVSLGCIAVALTAAYVLARRGRDRLVNPALLVVAMSGVVYVLLIALVSHGDSISGSFWAVGADFLHIVAASVWIGMLVQLGLLLVWLRGDIPDPQKRQLQAGHLSRFGTIAATSVAILLATGAANAAAQVPDWSALYDTAYGRALLLKLGIMAVLLLAGAVNAFYLRPHMVRDSDEGLPTDELRRRMSIAVRVELGLGVAVLLAAAILVLYPTGRQVRDAQAFEKASTEAIVGYEVVQPAPSGDLAVDFTVTPGTAGFNSFRVFLFPTGGGDIGDVLKVRMKINFHTEDLGQQIVDFDPVGEGVFSYKASGPYLTRPGQWDIDVTVQRRGVDDETVTVPVTVSSAGGAGQFSYPLVVGSWLSVAMAALMVFALLGAVWISEWPGLPELSPRFLRVGTAMLTVLGAGILALSLIPAKGPSSGNPIPASAQSIAAGHDLYVQNCSSCHGINGDGKGPNAGGLPVKPADFRLHIPYHQDTFFFNVITNGLGSIMPGWSATLTEDDRWNIINYLHSAFGQGAEPAPGSPTPAASGSPTPTPAASP
jgi:copper transport protein